MNTKQHLKYIDDNARSIIVRINIILSLIYKGINVVVQLSLIPLTIHYLDSEQYGIWLTLSAIIGWISFFDIGLGNGLRNKLTESLANDNYHLARSYISTSYAILVIIFISLALLFCIVNRFLNWSILLNTQSSINTELSHLALATFLLFCLRMILGLITNIIFAVQKAALNNLISALCGLLTILAIYFLQYFILSSLFWVGFIFSLVPVIVFIIVSIILFNKELKLLKPSLEFINFTFTRDLMGIGYKFFIIQIAGIVLFSSTNVIIAQLFGPAEVTAYNVSFRYFTILIMVYGIILSPLWSAFTDAYAKNDIFWIKRTVRKLNVVSLVFSFFAIIMILISDNFYKIWIGESVTVPKSISVAVGIYVIFSLFASPYNSFINGTGKIKLQYYTSIIAIVFTVPLAILFAKYFHWGVVGVIIATLCSTIPCTFLWKIQYEKLISNKAYGIWNQ